MCDGTAWALYGRRRRTRRPITYPRTAGIGTARIALDLWIARVAAPAVALTRTFADPAFRGCTSLNAGLEMHAGDHPVRPVARSHTAARGALIADLVRAEGVDDEATIDAIALLVEGVFAVSASRREPETAKRAARSAQRVLDLARS